MLGNKSSVIVFFGFNKKFSNNIFLTFQQRIGKTSSTYTDYNKLNPGNLSLIIINISNFIPVPIYKSDDVRQLKCSDPQKISQEKYSKFRIDI